MKCTPHEAAAKLLSRLEGMGKPIDPATFSEMTMEGKAAFAKNSNVYDTALAEDVALRNKTDIDTIASGGIQKLFGSKMGSFLTLSKDPGVILGEDFIKPLTDALQTHLEDFPGRGKEGYVDYLRNVTPIATDLKSKIQEAFGKDHGKMNYANRYLTAWESGGKFYDLNFTDKQDFKSFDPAAAEKIKELQAQLLKANDKIELTDAMRKLANRLPDTITKNLVSNNPFIAIANIFEFAPKALGIYGPEATAKGMIGYLKAGGLKGRIPALEARAVYDTPHKGLFGKFDLINTTETPLRGLAYHVAEAAGHDGLHGVEKIAFKYRPGREPLILLDHGSAATVALMRFSIEGAKMYGQWYKDIYTMAKGGDAAGAGKAAMGLALFHAMTAIQTGAASSVPAPLWGMMSEEQKDAIKALDEALPTNILKKATGQEFRADRMQPAGGVSFGLGYELANSAFNQGYKGTKKGVEALGEGDYLGAGVDFSKAVLSAGQAFVPGLNTSVRKIGDIIGDTLTGELQPEEIPAEAGKKLVGLDIGR